MNLDTIETEGEAKLAATKLHATLDTTSTATIMNVLKENLVTTVITLSMK